MYRTRDSVKQLTELGENKENIIELLEQLAELGWTQSHWVKYRNSEQIPFIEIYGDNSYKHIEGKTIEEAYEKALVSVKELKVCEHQWKYREDAFKLCEKCGQFGKATLQEMKERFNKFNMKDENDNKYHYSDEPICESCGHKEMIAFSHSRKDEIGDICPNCKTIVEKRLRKESDNRFGLRASPTDERYKKKIPYREKNLSMSIHKMVSFGRESEESLLQKVDSAYKRLMKSVDSTDKVINPSFELSEQEKNKYLFDYVMNKNFVLQKDENQYRVQDIKFIYSEKNVKALGLTVKKVVKKEEKPSDEEVLTGVIEALSQNIGDKEK